MVATILIEPKRTEISTVARLIIMKSTVQGLFGDSIVLGIITGMTVNRYTSLLLSLSLSFDLSVQSALSTRALSQTNLLATHRSGTVGDILASVFRTNKIAERIFYAFGRITPI